VSTRLGAALEKHQGEKKEGLKTSAAVGGADKNWENRTGKELIARCPTGTGAGVVSLYRRRDSVRGRGNRGIVSIGVARGIGPASVSFEHHALDSISSVRQMLFVDPGGFV
jgi:hypothetical protein